MSEAVLMEAPCPQCGCWFDFAFDCNCGAIHSRICHNCGRAQGLDLTEFPVSAVEIAGHLPCEKGKERHSHEGEFDIERVWAALRQQELNATRTS